MIYFIISASLRLIITRRRYVVKKKATRPKGVAGRDCDEIPMPPLVRGGGFAKGEDGGVVLSQRYLGRRESPSHFLLATLLENDSPL